MKRKRKRKRKRKCLRLRRIYFVEAAAVGLIKIGISGGINKRLSGLQSGSPVQLQLLFSTHGTPRQENALHRHFADDHVRGEWFTASDHLLAFIEELRSCDDVDAARILKRLREHIRSLDRAMRKAQTQARAARAAARKAHTHER